LSATHEAILDLLGGIELLAAIEVLKVLQLGLKVHQLQQESFLIARHRAPPVEEQ